jgi:hypothetical protein
MLMVPRIWKLVAVGLVLAVFSGSVLADDKADRERKAKAALALAAAAKAKATATAPAPRPADLVGYEEGSRRAVAGQYPIVVYCGFDGPRIADTVCVRDDEYAGIKAPAAVVGYPVGDRLMEEARFTGKPSEAQIERAAHNARRKMDCKPMPKRSESAWKISADVCPCKSCSCGPDCQCGSGACACPGCATPIQAQVQPAAPQPRYEVFEVWTIDRRGRLVKVKQVREVHPVPPPPPPVQPGREINQFMRPYYASGCVWGKA